MRLACLQIRLDVTGRAGILQALIAAIEHAARLVPAPDLLVLPGDCDTGMAAKGPGWYGAALWNVRESISSKAREWGVFIAVGLHVNVRDTLVPYAILFDADGDGVSISPPTAPSDSRGRPESKLWPMSGISVGVFEPTEVSGPSCATDPKGSIAIAVPASTKGRDLKVADSHIAALRTDPAVGGGAYWAVAVPAYGNGRKEMIPSFVRAPDGTILASADDGAERVVCAEIPTIVPSP